MAMAFLFTSAGKKIISQTRRGFGRNAKTLFQNTCKTEVPTKKHSLPQKVLSSFLSQFKKLLGVASIYRK